MKKKKRTKYNNPYNCPLEYMHDLSGAIFDPTTVIQDLNSLSKDECKEFKKWLEYEIQFWEECNYSYYEIGPLMYVKQNITD